MMINREAARKYLPFDLPGETPPDDFAPAEKECLSFLTRMLKKARESKKELEAAQKEAQRLWDQKEELRNLLYRLLVRNMIPVMDQCKLALGPLSASSGEPPPAPSSAPSTPAEQPPGSDRGDTASALVTMKAVGAEVNPKEAAVAEAAPAAAATPDRTVVLCLKSIERGVFALLDELGVERVDLVGKTYDNVEVEGQKIEEPFAILNDPARGKPESNVVKTVVQDLWISCKDGRIEVLRKGEVYL